MIADELTAAERDLLEAAKAWAAALTPGAFPMEEGYALQKAAYAYREEQPSMEEPTYLGAVVVDATGRSWHRADGSNDPWSLLEAGEVCQWKSWDRIPSPRPETAAERAERGAPPLRTVEECQVVARAVVAVVHGFTDGPTGALTAAVDALARSDERWKHWSQ